MKRKIADDQTAAAAAAAAAPPNKKRSPLLGKPQPQYDAPEHMKANMTTAQLAEWRKQMRKERNRASAAASRQKTQSRIMELEGEVTKWKSLYEDMQDKMMKLIRQVDLLTEVHCAAVSDQDDSASHLNNYVVSPTTSHQFSPSSSFEQIDALSLLQGLSRPQLVSSSDATLLLSPQFSSREEQTVEMKYTGANSLMNDKGFLPKLPECDLLADGGGATYNDRIADFDAHATPDSKSVEMLSSSSSSVSTESSNTDSPITADATTSGEGEENCNFGSDEELLDLLVETLEVDFDHNVLLP